MSGIRVKVDVEGSGGTVEIHVTNSQAGSSTDQNSKMPMKSGTSSTHQVTEEKAEKSASIVSKGASVEENEEWEQVSMDVETSESKGTKNGEEEGGQWKIPLQ